MKNSFKIFLKKILIFKNIYGIMVIVEKIFDYYLIKI